jgi:hypothetical protein
MEVFCRRKITVVGYLATSDPPDSFYRIEFGRIGWQENEYQAMLIRLEKWFEILGPVPSGVVQNQIDFALSRLEQITNKVAESQSTESGGFLSHKLTSFQVECSKEAHFVTDRRRKYVRLLPFECPHSHQTAVALKMDFVLAPKLNLRVLH